MEITASELRANIYKIIDRVIRTGESVEIRRKSDRVLLVPAQKRSKLKNLKRHEDYLKGDPEDIVHLDWSGEWNS